MSASATFHHSKASVGFLSTLRTHPHYRANDIHTANDGCATQEWRSWMK